MATETKTSLNKICHARYNYTTSLTPDTPFDIDIEMNEFSHKLHRNYLIFYCIRKPILYLRSYESPLNLY